MSGYPDEPRDYDDRDDRDDRGGRGGPRDERAVAAARAKIAAPAMLVILNGLMGLALGALLFIPQIVQPEIFVQTMRNVVANQPPGPDRQEAEKKLDDAENEIQQNRVAAQIENAVKLAVVTVGNLLAVLGGFAMRSLGSYGLSMTGSIVSIIPCVTGCCCTGMPFGIWALVVLMRPEVKAGFAAKRRQSTSPDSY